jgi:hypothetical protein
MHGYDVRITHGDRAGEVWTLQGREGTRALLIRRTGIGCAEFARVPLDHIEYAGE